MSIREKYNAFIEKNGCAPRYAEVSVIFFDDKEHVIDSYMVSFVHDEETDKHDNYIFYYCDSISELISLSQGFWTCSDFMVVEDSVCFTNLLY